MKNYQNKKRQFPPRSAGRRMTKDVPLASSEERILEVKNRLFEKMRQLETINYIYVVDEKQKLLGVFSIKEIFRQAEEKKIKEIMETEIIKVRPYTEQERVAILALKNNLKAIPIVNKKDQFLGVFTADTILGILHSENVDDFLKAAGIHGQLQEILRSSPLVLAKARIPWLILGLFGGLLAAQIVDFFESPLKSHFILAAFIPLIVYLADAVGTQTETLFIRSLVLENQFEIKKYLFREIKSGFLIALFLGSLLSILSLIWFHAPYFIGFILGISLFLTILAAVIVAILIPWILKTFKKDPAIGSGPFATVISDLLSLMIYFLVATLLLKIFS